MMSAHHEEVGDEHDRDKADYDPCWYAESGSANAKEEHGDKRHCTAEHHHPHHPFHLFIVMIHINFSYLIIYLAEMLDEMACSTILSLLIAMRGSSRIYFTIPWGFITT